MPRKQVSKYMKLIDNYSILFVFYMKLHMSQWGSILYLIKLDTQDARKSENISNHIFSMCTWSSLMSATRMQHVSVRVFLVFAVFYALSMQGMCSFFLHRAPEYLHDVTYMLIDSTRFLDDVFCNFHISISLGSTYVTVLCQMCRRMPCISER